MMSRVTSRRADAWVQRAEREGGEKKEGRGSAASWATAGLLRLTRVGRVDGLGPVRCGAGSG